MAKYQIVQDKVNKDIKDFLHESLGSDLIVSVLSSPEKREVKYFHNGDIMIVDTKTGKIDWDPINPGKLTTSKLSLRFHQWFAKGIIKSVEEGKS